MVQKDKRNITIKQLIIRLGSVLLIFFAAVVIGSIVSSVFGQGHNASVISRHRSFVIVGSSVLFNLLLITLGILSLIYRQRYEAVLCNIYLAFLSLVIVGPVGMETFFRLGIMTSKRFRDPGLYADYYSDDSYWKLYDLWKINYRAPRPERVHPILGKVNCKVTEENPLGVIRKTPYNLDYGPNTILFFGDSFVVGATPMKDKIPQIMDRLIPEMSVYNYGGSGYGVDQIFLRFQMAHKEFQKPIIIVGMLTNDIDRCVLSVRVGQKPYFKVEDNRLVLCGVPIEPNQSEWYRRNPPTMYSFAGAFLIRKFRILRANRNPYELTYKREEKKLICGKIIEELVQETRTKDLPLLLVFFYGERELQYTGWRETFLKEQAGKWDIPYVDTKQVLLQASHDRGIQPSEFFIQQDGHPTSIANNLIAVAIVNRLKKLAAERLGGTVICTPSSEVPGDPDRHA